MTRSVRIPADVDREDRILAGFTARQVAAMAVTGLVLYCGWLVTRAVLPVLAYLVMAAPIAAAVVLLVVVTRDGITLDRLLLAALRQRLSPRRRVAAPETPAAVPEWLSEFADQADDVPLGGLELPARAVSEAGVIDLGRDGLALVAACSTVNFALRTPAEQEALAAGFGRYLHSLTAGVQILVRTQRLDLTSHIDDLRHRVAASLPHPALEDAALDHADYLQHLNEQAELLRRQILLVVREPAGNASTNALNRTRRRRRENTAGREPSAGARRAAAARLVRRMHEAIELLAPAGIEATPLDAGQATAVLAAATNPDSPVPPSPEMAGAHEVITTNPDWDLSDEEDTP
ncbi:PrgI family protein [Saccharopolyspora elongata]|uniref:PrgI family protein n=1 Tax=Saccharopolyspora elongata TaxID=2530387 RepID=A0A4R4YGG3_9PSEU|nr:PrgI family protein [Saccharopolyspora elongata]TDD43074.1 PrgI family protein [Saccharopolyspora elongata]